MKESSRFDALVHRLRRNKSHPGWWKLWKRYSLWEDTDDLCMEAADTIESLRNDILERSRGYKGACYACEPVGETNVFLRDELNRVRSELDIYRRAFMNGGGGGWTVVTMEGSGGGGADPKKVDK